jgi:hypothetical protein
VRSRHGSTFARIPIRGRQIRDKRFAFAVVFEFVVILSAFFLAREDLCISPNHPPMSKEIRENPCKSVVQGFAFDFLTATCA